MNKAILITPVIAILLDAIPSAMAETSSQHYNVGYNDAIGSIVPGLDNDTKQH
jgi:hypothetical protein